MQDSHDLHDLLEGANAAPVKTPEQREAVADEHGTQASEPAGGKQDSTAPPADANHQVQEVENWTKQAALDERKKRQELEKRIAEYEERIRGYEQQRQQPKQQEQPPDWWSSPDKAAEVFQAQIQEQLYQTRVSLSEQFMRQQHADYDEVSTLFAEQAQRDPHLLRQLYSHPSPAQFAYQIGQQIRLMQEVGNDPAAYRKKIEDEIRAKLLAEQGGAQQPAQAQAKPTSQVPRSLARDVSQQPRVNGKFASYDTPASLDEILG